MKTLPFLLFLYCLLNVASAQVHCTLKDRKLAEDHLSSLSILAPVPPDIGKKAIEVGKRFLGTPYVGKTLEIGMEEELVINLHELDCTTFLENVVVMAGLWEEGRLNFEDFQNGISYLRYRQGRRQGYPSRLHYFSEWIRDNEEKGVLDNITARIGGQPFDKDINFMSTHRSAYQQLAEEENFRAIKRVEEKLAQIPLTYIPKSEISAIEGRIKDGDIIALTTSIKGLDVVHVGFAFHQEGRLHFLHASTGSNEVEISPQPLATYMSKIKHQTGIMVARLRER